MVKRPSRRSRRKCWRNSISTWFIVDNENK
jgi:hypothetical protein